MESGADGFVHLHVHSYYSFFDSTMSPEEIVDMAREQGAHSVALTDTNSMTGAVVFYKAALEAGIKPIIGVELTQPLPAERVMLRGRERRNQEMRLPNFTSDDPDEYEAGAVFPEDEREQPGEQTWESSSLSPALCHGDPNCRAVLLARNFSGYSEICGLVTDRMLDPEFDLLERVQGLSANLILLSDSVDVLAAAKLREPERATECASLVYGLLLPSRKRRKRNRAVYEFAAKEGLPLVAGCDAKLGKPGDAALHHLLQAMRRLTTVEALDDAARIDPAQYFQTEAAIRAFFGIGCGEERAQESCAAPLDPLFVTLEEAMQNTARIASECNCTLPLGEWKFPKLPSCTEPPATKLRKMVEEGVRERYGDPPPAEAIERMDRELKIVEQLEFTEYFLLVKEIVGYAHSRGFFTVGRGSAANSILSYALGFTDVCPIQFKLYFERFLNPERSSPPDIDIDFSWKDRDEVISWCFEHFGHEHVALISTIQTLQSRQAIREVAKAHGLCEAEVNAFNRLHETRFQVEEPGIGSDGRDSGNGRGNNGKGSGLERRNGGGNGSWQSGGSARPRVSDLSRQEPWPTILEQAYRIKDFPRHLSIHCGGMIITPDHVTRHVPLTRSAKGFVITQMDMFSVEDLGLIKIDLLSNRSLGVLRDALEMVERNSQYEAEDFLRKKEHVCKAAEAGASGDTEVGVGAGGDRSAENDVRAGEGDLPGAMASIEARGAVFQREAQRIKLAGTRRGTSVALAGVLGSFAAAGAAGGRNGKDKNGRDGRSEISGNEKNGKNEKDGRNERSEVYGNGRNGKNGNYGNNVRDEASYSSHLSNPSHSSYPSHPSYSSHSSHSSPPSHSSHPPSSPPLSPIRQQVLNFQHITSDPATRALIDQGLTMGCFYIESPGMRALFERLRCRNFDEVVTASSIIRPGVAESGMMQEYIARHQEQNTPASTQNVSDQPDETADNSSQATLLQRETTRAALPGSRSGSRVALALDMISPSEPASPAESPSRSEPALSDDSFGSPVPAYADPRSPTTLIPTLSASERLANGTMPINAHAKARAITEYVANQRKKKPQRPSEN